MWHIAFKVEFMWVDSGWVVWRGLPRQRWTLSISLFLRRFSKEAWEGLEKPLGTFRTESFVECGEKCSGLDGCGMIDYNMHDNRGYKWCTPAKVDHIQLHFILHSAVLSFFPQITCIHPDYQIRKKKPGYGYVPWCGDVIVYMFTEIPLCESALINH